MVSEASEGARVRALVRRAETATLASALARDGSGRPYASLVLATVDHDASPILLLSDLADHSHNVEADDRAALLFAAPPRGGDPLAALRVTLLGAVERVADGPERARLRARIVRRHPGAGLYAGFADFRLYRLAIDCAHLVAGFGDVHWIPADAIRLAAAADGALAAAEAEILDHMNSDHADAVALIAAGVAGGATEAALDAAWTMIGIDPEGIDLRRGGRLARAAFDAPIDSVRTARTALKTLTDRARARQAGEPMY